MKDQFFKDTPRYSPRYTVVERLLMLAVALVGVLVWLSVYAEGETSSGVSESQQTTLVLWNKLGSQNEITHSEIGGNGVFTGGNFTTGVFGGAYIAKADEQRLVNFPLTNFPFSKGTIEIWVKLINFPNTLDWGEHPDIIRVARFDDGATYTIHFNGNDGRGNGGLCGRAGRFADVGTASFGDWTYREALQGEDPTAWHHYALVWDSNGIAGVDNGQRKVAVFLDGQLNTGSWWEDQPSFDPFTQGYFTLLAHQGLNADSSVAFDNLKLWSGTKIDFSDRFTEGPAPSDQLYLSSTSGGTIGGVNFGDEDILRFTPSTNTWAKYFDGSDVGLQANDITAFILDGGNILMSLHDPMTVTKVGAVGPQDLLRFIPTSLGETTRGRFEIFLDGSDVGLNSSEAVDGADFAPDGRLVISTLINFSVPGASGTLAGEDEDLFVLNNARYGSSSAGTWTLYFDGTDVGLTDSSEDVRGIGFLGSKDVYLSTLAAFSVPGVSGDASDVLICTAGTLGSTTTCTYRLFFDGETKGFGDESIDGMDIASSTQVVTSADAEDRSVDETNDIDDAVIDDEETVQQSFLPMLQR